MKTTTQQTIIGYRYGGYWFGIQRNVISGLSGGSFQTERDLLSAYDSANGAERIDGPGLIRVHQDGTETVLRQGDNNKEASK